MNLYKLIDVIIVIQTTYLYPWEEWVNCTQQELRLFCACFILYVIGNSLNQFCLFVELLTYFIKNSLFCTSILSFLSVWLSYLLFALYETNTIRFLHNRWQKLLADSDARKQRLLRMQEQFRQIEELYLTFAKKASAFNSWFENAEEDLTDPVRCNSIEEIRALREAHAQFQASLSSAQADFEALAALDQQIKSFNVGPNPYTWFTMEALEDTWRNLQKIIKVIPKPW